MKTRVVKDHSSSHPYHVQYFDNGWTTSRLYLSKEEAIIDAKTLEKQSSIEEIIYESK